MKPLPPVMNARYRVEQREAAPGYVTVRDTIHDKVLMGRFMPKIGQVERALFRWTHQVHPCFLEIYRYLELEKNYLAIMPPLPSGEPLSAIKAARLKPQEIGQLFAGLVSALRFLGSQALYHPHLDLTKIYPGGMGPLTVIGHEACLPREGPGAEESMRNLDIRYAAPELLLEKVRTDPVDIYHLGALFYHFLSGSVLAPTEEFPGITRGFRTLKKRWDSVLGGMLAKNPADRVDWVSLWSECLVLTGEKSGFRIGPAWLGMKDEATLELLKDSLVAAKKEPQALALQAFPGRERLRRLAPFTRTARERGFLVFHSWTSEVETRPYKIINDLVLLLREGAIRHLERPDLVAELVPLSEWQSTEELSAKWQDLMARVFAALYPDHCTGIVWILEDIQHMDASSFETLLHLSSWLAQIPFVLVMTGDSFTHPHFRECESRWPFSWHYLFSPALDSDRLGAMAWLPDEEGGTAFTSALLADTAGEEVLVFYKLEDRNADKGAFRRHLDRVWAQLQPKEQLILKVLACSKRPLSGVDLDRAFHMRRLGAAMDRLAKCRLLEMDDKGACTVSIPALVSYCLDLIPAQDALHIRQRLLDHECGSGEPDPVQAAFLASRIPGARPEPFLAALGKTVMERGELDPVWRLDRIYRDHATPQFRYYHVFAELLRGLPLPYEKVKGLGPLIEMAKANRYRMEGNYELAFAAYKRITASGKHSPALKLHALVHWAEAASFQQDGLTVSRLFRRWSTLVGDRDRGSFHAEGLARMIAALDRCAKSLPGLTKKTEALPPTLRQWVEANRAWHEGDFQTVDQAMEKVLPVLSGHYDLNWKGLAYKLHGNALFRNNRPNAAIRAYREAESYYRQTHNRPELSNLRFNLATVENLAGRFASSAAGFQPIYERVCRDRDEKTQCQILYNFMVCSLFTNDLAGFEEYAHEHAKMAVRLKAHNERVKGLNLMLHAALTKSKDEISETVEELERVLAQHPPYPLLQEEAGTALRFGKFALGLQCEEPRPETEMTRWRHQFVDFLTGRNERGFVALVETVGDHYFGACHLFLLKTAIEAKLVPPSCLTESLAKAYEHQIRTNGAHYAAFLKRHFAHLRGLGEVPRREWETALHLFETVSWQEPRPDRLLKDLLKGLNAIWPFQQWGACRKKNRGWVSLEAPGTVEDLPFEIEDHFKKLGPSELDSPLISTLIHPNTLEAHQLMLLPMSRRQGSHTLIWLMSQDASGHELGAHYEPLFRFYAKLFEYVFIHAEPSSGSPFEREVPSPERDYGIVGRSGRMMAVLDQIHKVAPSDLNIYIWGESGTGKELAAGAVHRASDRADKPFRAINCSHYPENLLESELFGHVRGSFTGATADRPGVLALVDGGTLFLDEIGDLNPKAQSLLLRVIQEGEYSRIGETRIRKVDIRFVTATNKDLHRLIENKRFRGDLFFRLVEEEIRLPPLRERFEDLPLLASHFARKHGKRPIRFNRAFYDRMRGYTWPGNVREFESYIRKVLVHHRDADVIGEAECPEFLRADRIEETAEHTLEAFEKRNREVFLVERLERYGWNKTRAAKSLGISRQQLTNLIGKYRLSKN